MDDKDRSARLERVYHAATEVLLAIHEGRAWVDALIELRASVNWARIGEDLKPIVVRRSHA